MTRCPTKMKAHMKCQRKIIWYLTIKQSQIIIKVQIRDRLQKYKLPKKKAETEMRLLFKNNRLRAKEAQLILISCLSYRKI